MATLTTEQREQVTRWLASGKKNKEVIRLAAAAGFVVTASQVSKIKGQKKNKIAAAVEKREESILNRGIATREYRVGKLSKLEEKLGGLMERKGLWGSDDRFNAPLVKEYRGVLDDVAKEMGQRTGHLELGVDMRVTDIREIGRMMFGEAAGDGE